jgi:hypothetical protein
VSDPNSVWQRAHWLRSFQKAAKNFEATEAICPQSRGGSIAKTSKLFPVSLLHETAVSSNFKAVTIGLAPFAQRHKPTGVFVAGLPRFRAPAAQYETRPSLTGVKTIRA